MFVSVLLTLPCNFVTPVFESTLKKLAPKFCPDCVATEFIPNCKLLVPWLSVALTVVTVVLTAVLSANVAELIATLLAPLAGTLLANWSDKSSTKPHVPVS